MILVLPWIIVALFIIVAVLIFIDSRRMETRCDAALAKLDAFEAAHRATLDREDAAQQTVHLANLRETALLATLRMRDERISTLEADLETAHDRLLAIRSRTNRG